MDELAIEEMENLKKNKRPTILVVGNGFDLHHGMKTQYADFLSYALSVFRPREEKIDNTDELIKELLYANTFFLFLKDQINEGKTWIDMETEIREFIFALSRFIENPKITLAPEMQLGFETETIDIQDAKLISYMPKYFEKRGDGLAYILLEEYTTVLKQIDKENIFSGLQQEFSQLTKALQLYLSEVEPQRRNTQEYEADELIRKINPDYALSFNYTDTLEQLYQIPENRVCYYHGSLKKDNIVLGYENDSSMDDLVLQKYYRRFICHTDIVPWDKYWVSDEMGCQQFGIIYFYGHSLDISDKEILLKLIDSRFKVNIFIRSEKDYADKIKKLIILLGKEKAEEKIEKDISFIETSDYWRK